MTTGRHSAVVVVGSNRMYNPALVLAVTSFALLVCFIDCAIIGKNWETSLVDFNGLVLPS
jgi:hypothetical protein